MLGFPNSANYIIRASSAGQPHEEDIHRPIANFPAEISGARFTSFTPDKQLCSRYVKEIQTLKQEVSKRIVAKESKRETKLNLIDTVERLGISYYFEEEIKDQLDSVSNGKWFSEKYSADLSTISLQFRLFRQHGLDISSDIFEQFTTPNGKFKDSLKGDTKGLLNLYEASYLRTHRDNILEEALIFAKNHLSAAETLHLHSSSCPSIEKQVKRALQQPLHRGIPRVEARYFISAYEDDLLKDESLLRMAKLDYNLLQFKYKEELSTLLRWWKEMDLPAKVPYAKDRLIANYFFGMAIAFEPQYSMLRLLLTKGMTVGTYVDDTYDAYGTLDELDVLTSAMERWDINEIDHLPKYTKIWYEAFLKTLEELEHFSLQQGRPYAFYHVKEMWKEYCRCSNIQSKWLFGDEIPTFDDYLKMGWITSGLKATIVMCYLAIESATQTVFDWLSHDPQMLVAASLICRLRNDLASYKFEKERGTTTSIQFYMKNYDVTEEEACKKFNEMYEDSWKDFNEEYYQKAKSPIATSFLQMILNAIRITDAAYKNNQDCFADSEKVMGPILDQLLETPFTV